MRFGGDSGIGGRRTVIGHGRTRGFTLLVISVVVFLLSLVVAVAVPIAQDMIREQRAESAAVELRRFDTAFQIYARTHGDWPAATAPGIIPTGMESALAGTDWTRETPIGGRYAWQIGTLHRGEHVQAAIAIVSVPGSRVTEDQRQLEELDRQVDDGSPATGRLRLGFRNEPVFVLEH